MKNIWEMEQSVYAYPRRLLSDSQGSAEEADHKLSNLLVSTFECAKLFDRQLKSLQVLSDLYVDKDTTNVIWSRFPNLTKLGLFADENGLMNISEMKSIVKALKKLTQLQRLRITGFPKCERHLENFPSELNMVTLCKTLKTLLDKPWSSIGLEKVELSGWSLSLKELVFKLSSRAGNAQITSKRVTYKVTNKYSALLDPPLPIFQFIFVQFETVDFRKLIIKHMEPSQDSIIDIFDLQDAKLGNFS
ncbi:hypothetical protein FNV43_RR01655 [Rhamnella rubrinervis]|uniref:Uncharacterized protein n=1 Tax=Rhamnella rubrinervis TaxID=2594499 RepID=A0A8K0MT66_9ROSA|nr:hypothetical protein FNV43_RR01655 [Rhamnella rubrinervis]